MKIAIDIGHPVIEKPNNFFNGRAIFLQTGTGISSPVAGSKAISPIYLEQ